MSLTREDLISDVTRHELKKTTLAARMLDDAALEQSRRLALQGWDHGESLWIFGYGSLIWNPQLDFSNKEVGRIHGYHRRLCLWSRVNRGTPERPGLVFGLERGGSCVGIAYEIAAHHIVSETSLLWRREMLLASYIPTWVSFLGRDRTVRRALTFCVDPKSFGYAGKLRDDHIISVLRQAHGRYGSCAEYVSATLTGLRAAGIRDRRLENIVRAAKISAPASEKLER